MKHRKLRIAWSVAWGVVAVLLVALWVRSYWSLDTIYSRRMTMTAILQSFNGRFGIASLSYPTAVPLSARGTAWTSSKITSGTQVNYNDGTGRALPSYLGFQSSWLSSRAASRVSSILVVPYWSVFVFSALAGSIIWVKSLPWRFSIRTLLIATTLVAVGLGLIVWLSQ